MTAYLLAYDAKLLGSEHGRFVSFVKRAREIEDWSSPFDGCFLLISHRTAIELNALFIEYLGGKFPFVVTPIVAQQSSGNLQSSVWKWVRQKIGPAVDTRDGSSLGITD